MENKARKVLIADDEPDIRELLQYNLSAAGFEVILAKDGDEALDKAKKNKPDLILLDVMMPKKSGVEVCKILRSQIQFSETLIVMLTALNDDGSVVKGLETGADDYIGKPVSPKVLISRLQALFRRQNKPESATLSAGSLSINTEQFLVTVEGNLLPWPRKSLSYFIYWPTNQDVCFLETKFLPKYGGMK